jgi:hypothetical protein
MHLNRFLLQKWDPDTELPDLTGKVAIVTGAKYAEFTLSNAPFLINPIHK